MQSLRKIILAAAICSQAINGEMPGYQSLDSSLQYIQEQNKPNLYLELKERSRYLVLRKDFGKATIELRLSGAWDYNFKEKRFSEPKGELLIYIFLKKEIQ